MTETTQKKPGQSVYVLIGILLTLAVMFAHRFLPERRLTLDTRRDTTNVFLEQFGSGTPAKIDWADPHNFHFTCDFAKDTTGQSCSFNYLFYRDAADRGVDLSGFRKVTLGIRYTGNAHYIRFAVRNFDPRFSKVSDPNSGKFISVYLYPKDLVKPLDVGLDELSVPEWWTTSYDLPRDLTRPDFRNITALSIDPLGDFAGTRQEMWIDKIEFSGDWISAEYWYMGILCLWMVIAAAYGVTQWAILHRRHREQRRQIRELETEKDKYQKLSTIDNLTKVLNRHGIEQFVEARRPENLPTSVIVIDLDHFKKINDARGHAVGDRVLQTVGEVLRQHTRNTDGLGRWGGEEFVLVCPGASLSKAADLAEKLRQRILQTNFIPEDPLSVTASLGVATAPAGGSFDDVFRQADEALYLAKSRGRNCVVAAAADQMHTMTGARKGTWALLSGRFKIHK